MARPKRTPDQRERDLAETARLHLAGRLQHEIAEVMGVSRVQISYDLKTVRQRWREQAQAATEQRIAEELAKLANLEREHWEAWERSLQDRVTRTVEEGKDDTGKTIIKTEIAPAGDPRFLAGVAQCIDRRCRLLGLDAPTRIAPTTPDGSAPFTVIDLDEFERAAKVRQILERATPS